MEEFLPLVLRPARYIDHEINAIHKDPARVKTWVALIFPDTYEIGISHLGLKILYKILNDISGVAAERVYAPWIDYEDALRARGLPLRSLESSMPLKDFDILGFTLQYELSYTNILNILDLSYIPLKSEDRDKDYPLIIAGGPCAFNPEPLVDFIDLFVIGDGEEAIVDLVDIYKEWKDAGGTKDELLKRLSRLEGFYVPSFCDFYYSPDGRINKIKGDKVRKRILWDLDNAPFPNRPIIPYIKAIHDRVTLEIARGCTRGCRFCQAGMIYRPLRERSPERIICLVEESLKSTGYEEVSLSSLSSGDYSNLLPLLRALISMLFAKKVSISLPSLRIGTLSAEIIQEIKKIRKTGFTIAPEAGTQRLRKVINKELDEGELMKTVGWIFKEGWETLKLYFMVGLPTEKEDDLKGIIDTVRGILKIGKGKGRRPPNINLSISAFVPKAHTPFQWKGQLPIQEIRERLSYIKGYLRDRRLNHKGQRPEMAFLEATFARGDRRLGPVISNAFRGGCRFDGWTELFDYSKWLRAFEEAGVDPSFYANRDIGLEEPLPWDLIGSGLDKEFLRLEYKKAFLEEVSEDCRLGQCLSCGLPCEKVQSSVTTQDSRLKIQDSRLIPYTSRTWVRFRFSKTAPMSFLSHLELMTAIQRAVARADLPIAFSKGFNPHPRISFGPALPVGIDGLREYLDMELISPVDIKVAVDALNSTLPAGLHIHEAKHIARETESLSKFVRRYIYCLSLPETKMIKTAKEKMATRRILIYRETEKGVKEIDIRPMIADLTLNGSEATVTLQDTVKASVKPVEVLRTIFGEMDLEALRIRRVRLLGFKEGVWVDPFEL